MVISYACVFRFGRTEMQTCNTDLADLVVTEFGVVMSPKFLVSSCDH